MTPKQKAEELINKMFNVDLDCDNESMCMFYPHAIKCALIAVDETLKAAFYSNDEIYNFYIEVKQEIEKL